MAVPSFIVANTYGATLTSTGLVGVVFGFTATQIVVKNDGTGPAYINMMSSNAASTVAGNGFPLSSGETLDLQNVQSGVISIAATSTVNSVRVGAWG